MLKILFVYLHWIGYFILSLALRHGISAGPDAGRFPLQSCVPRALQHVQAVHAQQTYKA